MLTLFLYVSQILAALSPRQHPLSSTASSALAIIDYLIAHLQVHGAHHLSLSCLSCLHIPCFALIVSPVFLHVSVHLHGLQAERLLHLNNKRIEASSSVEKTGPAVDTSRGLTLFQLDRICKDMQVTDLDLDSMVGGCCAGMVPFEPNTTRDQQHSIIWASVLP